MCGFLSAINAPVEPFDVLIQPADKLLACEAEVLPNNWESYGLELQLGDARARRSEMAAGGSERLARIMGLGGLGG
jgi:hypothetical protein